MQTATFHRFRYRSNGISGCWRSSQQSRVVKHVLSEMFQEDVLGLNGMRALVLIGNNDPLLAQWSEGVIRAGDGEPSISDSQSQSWNFVLSICLRSTKVSVPPFLSPLSLKFAAPSH